MNKHVISVDWFQYWCKNERHVKLVLDTFFQGSHHPELGRRYNYQVCPGRENHSIFRDSWTICLNKASMVHIFMKPKMSGKDPDACSVKVANRLLYKQDWAWFLHDIIDALGFKVLNITRMDLCLDFQRFDYKDMQPNDFIHAYIADKCLDEDETYCREGSNVFCAYGAKRAKAMDGSKTIDDNTEISIKSSWEYIRWGSRCSGVCTYLYNKSKELRDKKSKPWIADRWKEAGLNEKEADIYRIEFSISAKGMQLTKRDRNAGRKSLTSEEVHLLSIDNVATQEELEWVFWCYASKYFQFRIVGNQKYRKDMKRVQLFDIDFEPDMLPTYINSKVNAGRAETNAAKVLERLQFTCLALTIPQQQILYQARQVLADVGVQLKDLRRKDVENTYDIIDLTKIPDLTSVQKDYIQRAMLSRMERAYPFYYDPRVVEVIDMLTANESLMREIALLPREEQPDIWLSQQDEEELCPF